MKRQNINDEKFDSEKSNFLDRMANLEMRNTEIARCSVHTHVAGLNRLF